MSEYNKKTGKGKLGANLIRSFTDENQCYFHEIKQENDVGIDAFIEFTKNGENDGKCIAVQIKCGDTFFNKLKTEAKIPIGSHYGYWKNHSLDVYGAVCDIGSDTAYWVCISDYLENNSSAIESGKLKSIKFPLTEFNKLNKTTFGNIFKRVIYGSLPDISYEQTVSWTHSKFETEKIIAIRLLAENNADEVETWDIFFEMLKTENDYRVLFEIVKYFSYIPHHPDLCGGLNFSDVSKEHGIKLIKSMDIPLIVKMLSLIGDEGVSRGTIGQSVESIINLIPDKINILNRVINRYGNDIGENAFTILAYYDPPFILANEKYYISILGKWAETVIEFCKKFGYFELYI